MAVSVDEINAVVLVVASRLISKLKPVEQLFLQYTMLYSPKGQHPEEGKTALIE